MPALLNHTIVNVRDKQASAAFLAELLGLPEPSTYGPFRVVAARQRRVPLDFVDDRGPIHPPPRLPRWRRLGSGQPGPGVTSCHQDARPLHAGSTDAQSRCHAAARDRRSSRRSTTNPAASTAMTASQ